MFNIELVDCTQLAVFDEHWRKCSVITANARRNFRASYKAISERHCGFRCGVQSWAPAEIFPEGGKTTDASKVETFSARRTKIRPFFGVFSRVLD